jgi:Protein of unknown function (DUF1236)
MTNRFLISAAAIALMASAGFANAQGTGMSREQGGAATQPSAPSTGNSAAPSNREAVEPSGPSSGMKSTQSEPKSPAGAAKNQRTEENAQGQKSKGKSSENETKGKSSENETKGAKDLKADGPEGRDRDQNAQTRDRNDNMNAQTKSQTTTGQAGAGAKLTTEQRTRITTAIHEERVAPVGNVTFSIAVGTRVPREGVSFHPLPVEVVTIYPEWRGYEFILVRNQIVVIDPETSEIVAVLDV